MSSEKPADVRAADKKAKKEKSKKRKHDATEEGPGVEQVERKVKKPKSKGKDVSEGAELPERPKKEKKEKKRKAEVVQDEGMVDADQIETVPEKKTRKSKKLKQGDEDAETPPESAAETKDSKKSKSAHEEKPAKKEKKSKKSKSIDEAVPEATTIANAKADKKKNKKKSKETSDATEPTEEVEAPPAVSEANGSKKRSKHANGLDNNGDSVAVDEEVAVKSETAEKKTKKDKKDKKDKIARKKAKLAGEDLRSESPVKHSTDADVDMADGEGGVEETSKNKKNKKGDPTKSRFIAFVGTSRSSSPIWDAILILIIIGNLPFDTKKKHLEEHFKKIPPKNIRMIQSKETNKFKGFAFLEWEDWDKLQTAFQLYHHTEFSIDSDEKTKRKINVEIT
jgi:nucleolar protein 6